MFSTTICGRSSRPAPYAENSASIVRQRSSASSSEESMTCSKQTSALEVREELVPETDALARALDQPGHVGDDELPAVRSLDGAEHRRERRERIVGDLRPRVREPRDQRRLAGVRQPDERGVREKLEPELDLALLAGHADLCEARRLPRRRLRSACCRGRPVPPFATTTRAPGCARSATSRSSSSRICVPTGTARTTSSPSAPFESRPPPPPPRPARSFWFGRNPERSRRRGSATSTTSPPLPPSPPSGPPFGHELLAAEVDGAVTAAAGAISRLGRGTFGSIVEHDPRARRRCHGTINLKGCGLRPTPADDRPAPRRPRGAHGRALVGDRRRRVRRRGAGLRRRERTRGYLVACRRLSPVYGD